MAAFLYAGRFDGYIIPYHILADEKYIFSNLFARFIGVSIPRKLLSGTFETQNFRLFQLCLWLVVWSRLLPLSSPAKGFKVAPYFVRFIRRKTN